MTEIKERWIRRHWIIAVGFFIGLFVWAADSFIDIRFPAKNGFSEDIFNPNTIERALMLVGFVLFASLAETAIKKHRQLIEEKEQIIEERDAALRELERSHKKLKLLAYSLPHDLKSTAIAITWSAEGLLKKCSGELENVGQSYCKIISEGAKQIEEMVNDTNHLIQSKEATLKFEEVNIKDILAKIKESFSPQIKERGILWIEPDVIPLVKADKLAMERIFTNITDNSLNHAGPDLSRIVIKYEGRKDSNLFSYNDDGTGIVDGNQKVFEMFFRLSKAKGTGLGLAIVKELIERHGGKVWMKSGPRAGTTFYLQLPKNPA